MDKLKEKIKELKENNKFLNFILNGKNMCFLRIYKSS